MEIVVKRLPSPAYARALADRILDAELPGGRLPAERRLAAELGVTHTMVRNALALLEAEGRISREVGRGTFLRSGATDLLLQNGDDEISPADVMAARRLIEPRALQLVVARATTRDFEELDRCLAGGDAARTFEEYEYWNFALHHAIVATCRNRLVIDMYRIVENVRESELWGNMKRRNDSQERRAASTVDHYELVAALRARELARAVAIMDRHLARVEANLLGTDPQAA
jgi:DNA-binding FadR family transcriptional regulator